MSQGKESNWSNRNPSNIVVPYVPPYQRGYQGYQNPPHPQQCHSEVKGPNYQYQANQGQQGDYHPNQEAGPTHQGPASGQPNPKYSRHVNELVGDILNSLQHQSDVVKGLQEAQQEQKAAMDMLSKQLSEVATSLSEMRGNEGRIPTTVGNISQVTMRSGKEYQGPTREVEYEVPNAGNKKGDDRTRDDEQTVIGDVVQLGNLRNPLPKWPTIFTSILNQWR